jgi:hypothetical protein
MRAISLRTPVELCGSHSADRSSRTSLNFRISLVTRQLPGMWRIADSSRAPGSIRMNQVEIRETISEMDKVRRPTTVLVPNTEPWPGEDCAKH